MAKVINPNVRKHSELYSTHAEYDPELNLRLQLLYEGGFRILKHANIFLERMPQLETKQAYDSRLKCVAYIPYESEFITQFSASLFSETLEVIQQTDAPDPDTLGQPMTDDFYKQFLESCDYKRRSFHQFMQDSLEVALSELCCYITLDFPKGERLTRAQEKADGLDRGYACTVPYCNVIDWKVDPATGKFIWVKEFEEIFPDDNPLIEPQHYYQFKFRTMKKNAKGDWCGGWDIWKTARMPLTKKFDAATKYTLDKSEEVITSFPEINLWKLEINKAYHVGQQIGSLCQEHYQRRSFMVANANKTCVALGVVTLGPEVGAPGDALPMDLEVPTEATALRRQLESEGWVVMRQTGQWADKVEIIEAKGESHKFIAEELKHLVESMMQTLRQMNMTATANQKAVGRSAASKSMDQHGTSMLLSVYERVVKDFSKLLFTCLAQGREESIFFAAEGLSIAEPTFDRTQTVSELTQFGVDVLKFPDMWKSKYLKQAASELIDNNLTDKERLELSDKFDEAIQAGEFEALDPEEAAAAGNKMAQNVGNATSAPGPDGKPADPSQAPAPNQPIPDKSGTLTAPPTMHLRAQSAKAGIADTVYKQLLPQYDPQLLGWIKAASWTGPAQVSLDMIDDSNRANWGAAQDDKAAKRAEMGQKMQEGWDKPIILVNEPNDNKLRLIDGHTRYLSAEEIGKETISAYIADVSSVSGDWEIMHDLQGATKVGELETPKTEQLVESNQK